MSCWQLLDCKIEEMGLQPLNQVTLENVLGAGPAQTPEKIALTLRAELASRLITIGGSTYCPNALIRACVKTIYTVENLNQDSRDKLKQILNTL